MKVETKIKRGNYIYVHLSIIRQTKPKTVTKDKEGQYLMTKQLIHQEDITITNIYTPNTGAPTYIKQIHPKGEIDNNRVIVQDFNTPLSAIDSSFRQIKISK